MPRSQRAAWRGTCDAKPGAGLRVVLYTRTGCHLCEAAKSLLEKYRPQFGLAISEVDIDSNPALRAQYDSCVPVVEIDGKVRFRGQVSEVLLLRLFKRQTMTR